MVNRGFIADKSVKWNVYTQHYSI